MPNGLRSLWEQEVLNQTDDRLKEEHDPNDHSDAHEPRHDLLWRPAKFITARQIEYTQPIAARRTSPNIRLATRSPPHIMSRM